MKKSILLVACSLIAFIVNISIHFHFYNLFFEISSRFLLNLGIFLVIGFLVKIKTDKFEKALVVVTSFMLVFVFAKPALASDIFQERYKDFVAFKNLDNAWTTVSINHFNHTLVFTNLENGTYEMTHEVSTKDPLYLKGDFTNFDETKKMRGLDINYRLEGNKFYAMYDYLGYHIYFYGLADDKTKVDWLKQVILQ